MTTATEIAQWFDQGVSQKATHMIVVCDSFSYEDYPVYATDAEHCKKQYQHYDGNNMQRVMEVYDLQEPKAPQMSASRTMCLPQ